MKVGRGERQKGGGRLIESRPRHEYRSEECSQVPITKIDDEIRRRAIIHGNSVNTAGYVSETFFFFELPELAFPVIEYSFY